MTVAEIPTLLEVPVLAEIRARCTDGATGILTLKTGQNERVDLCFRDGVIDACSVAHGLTGSYLSSRRLGHYLVEDAGVPVQDLVAVQSEARRQNLRVGEAAIRRGLVDAAGVRALVRHQCFDLLHQVLANEATADGFLAEHRAFSVPGGIPFEEVLLELARNAVDPFIPGNDLISLVDSRDLSIYPWYPGELKVLGSLSSPRTFEDLKAATRLEEDSLTRILGVLRRLDLIETHEVSVPAPYQASANGASALSRFPLDHLVPVTVRPVLDEKLRVAKDGGSFTNEQFKSLKVQLSEYAGSEHKVFAVSSPDPGDGKSLVAVSLAFSFATDANKKVLIIDCDLRNPAVERYLGVSSEPGVLQYLQNGAGSPHCYLRRIDNLYFLTAGGLAANAIESLSMDKMKNLIRELQHDFDTIILDAPPYSPIADARLVTGLSDGLILVVRRGKTGFANTDRTLKAVDQSKLLGVVFNDVRPMLFNTQQTYGYYGYGRDQYVYGDRQIPSSPKAPQNYLDQ